jgi:hypothetical protein
MENPGKSPASMISMSEVNLKTFKDHYDHLYKDHAD